jgi:hypothetical protein
VKYGNAPLVTAESRDFFTKGIPSHFVLLDSDSSISIFNNASMLDNIHGVNTPLALQSNGGGHQLMSPMGTVPNFGKVWYNPNSIPTFCHSAKCIRPAASQWIAATMPPSTSTFWMGAESGLYLHDTSKGKTAYDSTTINDKEKVIGYSHLQTVAENKKLFTKCQIDATDMARQLYQILGRPGAARLLDIVCNNHIINCPVTFDDITRAERIHGEDVAFLQGKTAASPANDHVPNQPPHCLTTRHSVQPWSSHTLLRHFLCARTPFLPISASEHPLPVM